MTDGGHLRQLPAVRSTVPVRSLLVCGESVWCAEAGGAVARRAAGAGTTEVKWKACGEDDEVWSMCLQRERVWAGCASGAIRVLDAWSGSPTAKEIPAHRAGVRCMLAHGSRVYSSGDDGAIREWNTETMRPIRTLQRPRAATWTSWSLSARGMALFSCSDDPTVRAWDLRSGEQVGALVGHKAAVRASLMVQATLWTGGDDAHVRVWDAAEGTCRAVLTAHQGSISALCQCGPLVASASSDGGLCLWQPDADGAPVLLASRSVAAEVTAIAAAACGEELQLWAGTATGRPPHVVRWGVGDSAQPQDLTEALRKREQLLAEAGEARLRLEADVAELKEELRRQEKQHEQELARRDAAFRAAAPSPEGEAEAAEITWMRAQLGDTMAACAALRRSVRTGERELVDVRKVVVARAEAARRHIARTCAALRQLSADVGRLPDSAKLLSTVSAALSHARRAEGEVGGLAPRDRRPPMQPRSRSRSGRSEDSSLCGTPARSRPRQRSASLGRAAQARAGPPIQPFSGTVTASPARPLRSFAGSIPYPNSGPPVLSGHSTPPRRTGAEEEQWFAAAREPQHGVPARRPPSISTAQQQHAGTIPSPTAADRRDYLSQLAALGIGSRDCGPQIVSPSVDPKSGAAVYTHRELMDMHDSTVCGQTDASSFFPGTNYDGDRDPFDGGVSCGELRPDCSPPSQRHVSAPQPSFTSSGLLSAGSPVGVSAPQPSFTDHDFAAGRGSPVGVSAPQPSFTSSGLQPGGSPVGVSAPQSSFGMQNFSAGRGSPVGVSAPQPSFAAASDALAAAELSGRRGSPVGAAAPPVLAASEAWAAAAPEPRQPPPAAADDCETMFADIGEQLKALLARADELEPDY